MSWFPFLETPTRMNIFAASGSGKTHFLLHEILGHESPPFDVILWLAPGASLQQAEIADMIEKKNFNGVPFYSIIANKFVEKTMKLLEELKKENLKICFVIDDLISKKTDESAFITNLYTAGRHLGVVLLIEMAQRIFINRTNRLNTNHIIVGRLGGATEFNALITQIYSDKKLRADVLEAYNEIMRTQKYGFIWLDLSFLSEENRALAFRVGWDKVITFKK